MFPKILRIVSVLLAIAGIFWICTFKVLDRDYWWHIKAGEIVWKTGALIKTDPFAHTREGLPYISSHHWLAQITLYGVWSAGGATAQILFRGLLVTSAFLLLLLIDTKRVFPNFIVVLVAAYFNRPSFMDRPQLFSFVFFCAFLLAATYYLRRSSTDNNVFSAWRKWFLLALTLLQVLWVNTHGAAAMYGIFIFLALLLQRGSEWIQGVDRTSRSKAIYELKYLVLTLIVLAASALLSPNGLRTFQDVFVYTSDQTLGLVREWQPRGFGGYMQEIAPFGLLAVLTIFFGKRHRVYCSVLIFVFGYLSTQAYRHGIFFIFAALSILFYQAGSIAWYRKKLKIVLNNYYHTLGVTVLLLAIMTWFARYDSINVLEREGYSGYGAVAAAEGAYAFVEENNIQGNMFNTYGIGDYLLYRGYPSRKVYMDGRNIDYGYDFLREATSAAFDSVVWKRMEQKYKLDFALIEYPLAPGASSENDLPYVVHLSKNADWALVYIDDKIAVYVKRVPNNAALIFKFEYKYITPKKIEFGTAFAGSEKDDIAKIEEELERAAKSNTKSIKASLILAHHFADTKKLDLAATFANEAAAAQPYRPEVYEALGIVAASAGQFARSGAFFEESIHKMGGGGLPVHYNFLADIFEKAGDVAKSSYYHQKAK